MEITFERSPAFALGITCIHTVLLVITVAGIPGCAMLAPGSHAHPTKFVFAFFAGHVAARTSIESHNIVQEATHLQPPFFSIVLWH